MKIVSNGQTLAVPFCASQDIYSLEEKVVGRWIDGKPVYRSIIQTTTASNDNTTKMISVSNLNIDNIVSFHGIANIGTMYILPIPYIYTNSMICLWFDLQTNGIGVLHTSSNYSSQPIAIYLEYTKTTDQSTIELPSSLTAAPAQSLFTAAPQSAAAVTLDAGIKQKEVSL